MIDTPVTPAPRPPGKRREQTTLRRLLLALLAVVCCTGQLAQVLHLVLVPHTTCAQHGELFHGSTLRGNEISVASSSAPGRDPALVPSDEPEHEHEHCLVTALRPLAIPGAPIVLTDPPCASTPDPCVPPTKAAGRDVLAFAPKTSPPDLI